MKTVMNKYSDLDIQPLKTAIIEKANLLLTEITEENLKTFLQAVTMIAEGVMEQYVFKVYNLYSKGEFKIANIDTLVSFTDYCSGYQSKMLNWIKSNPIQLQEQNVEMPKRPKAPQINKHQPVITISIGTATAIGSYIFTNAWVALATEILTLVIAYRQKAKQQKDKRFYESELKAYNIQLGKKRMALINGLTEDLVKWLEMGKEYSNYILLSYNL